MATDNSVVMARGKAGRDWVEVGTEGGGGGDVYNIVNNKNKVKNNFKNF